MFHVKHPAAATTNATRRPRCGCFTPRTRDAAESAVKQRVRDCQRRHDPGTPTCVCAHRANSLRFTQVATAVRAGSGRIFGHHRTAGPAARPYNGAASDSHHLLESQRGQTPAPVRAFLRGVPRQGTPTIGTTRGEGVFHVKLPRTRTQRNGHQFTPPACRPHGDQARRSVRGWVALATPAAHSSRPPVAPRGQFERSPDVSPTPVTLPPIGETPAGAGRFP